MSKKLLFALSLISALIISSRAAELVSEISWNQAKRHLRKFNGIPRQNFGLFLKECEWRFNTPTAKAQLTHLIDG
jgi:transposase-like protein